MTIDIEERDALRIRISIICFFNGIFIQRKSNLFPGKRLRGVRVETEVIRERVRKRQSGQVLFRQHFQDRRVLRRL